MNTLCLRKCIAGNHTETLDYLILYECTSIWMSFYYLPHITGLRRVFFSRQKQENLSGMCVTTYSKLLIVHMLMNVSFILALSKHNYKETAFADILR